MFRNGLLISTAMTAVALLLSPVQHAAAAQTDMRMAPSDPNARFLCTYGSFKVSASVIFTAGGRGIFASAWEHVAVPVTGRGETVTSISVIEGPGKFASFSSFSAGIYSNTASGFPGKPIAVGKGPPVTSCGPVTISIAPTKLRRHKTYWIEETVQNRYWGAGADTDRRTIRPLNFSASSSSLSFYWFANPYTKRRTYVQTHHFCHTKSCQSSYTSPVDETIGRAVPEAEVARC